MAAPIAMATMAACEGPDLWELDINVLKDGRRGRKERNDR